MGRGTKEASSCISWAVYGIRGFRYVFSVTFWMSGIFVSKEQILISKRKSWFQSYSATSCCMILHKLLNLLDLWNGRIFAPPLGDLSITGILSVRCLVQVFGASRCSPLLSEFMNGWDQLQFPHPGAPRPNSQHICVEKTGCEGRNRLRPGALSSWGKLTVLERG